jgi:hypothetical protein
MEKNAIFVRQLTPHGMTSWYLASPYERYSRFPAAQERVFRQLRARALIALAVIGHWPGQLAPRGSDADAHAGAIFSCAQRGSIHKTGDMSGRRFRARDWQIQMQNFQKAVLDPATRRYHFPRHSAVCSAVRLYDNDTLAYPETSSIVAMKPGSPSGVRIEVCWVSVVS